MRTAAEVLLSIGWTVPPTYRHDGGDAEWWSLNAIGVKAIERHLDREGYMIVPKVQEDGKGK